jgi:curved DNA-binding protein CbpA
VRIPLDYYRILGLPLAASYEQLRQAYNDRIVQLPRREYSQAAITSRKQLIEEAYVVLSDPKERKAYDQVYLAHAYGSDGVDAAVAVEDRFQRNNDNIDGHNLTIEISQNELVGALLILQELGEYELVLKLGRPYIVSKNGGTGANSNYGSLSEEAVERPDVVLTVALACLELGREQWQQGHYENAAISLETGEELLSREGLFPRVRDEIIADLYRLRPYRILELLELPEEKTAEREQGLRLLREVLDQRGGIDGSGNDQSGLSMDDFLRFIQQLRNYLTVAEQHELFEEQSKRPSAVSIYLAVYTLIARGFAQHQPALIRQAKQLLSRLSKRQDVHLEQSLCALLLGQTEVATRTLELSQEYEALAFIRENSQGSPDLLPGLCLYGERWLQNEVFPHFRDLAGRQASLKEYFANQQVQAYLEALPIEVQTTNEPSSQSFPYGQSTYPDSPINTTGVPQQPYENRTTERKPEYPNISPPSFPKSPTSSYAGNPQTQAPMTGAPTPERTRRRTNYNSHSNAPSPQPPPTPRRRRQRSQTHTPGHSIDNRHHFAHRQRPIVRRTQQLRLLLLVLASLAGLVIFLTIVGWLKDLFFSAPSMEQQLSIELNQPVVPIPAPNSKQESPTGSPITQDTAKEVVQTWLSTKAAALGPNHEIDRLAQILVSPALSQWRLITQQLKTDNRYRKYQHTVKVESLEPGQADNNHATVEASVTEMTDYYENGQMKKSEKEQLRVKYDLVRVQDAWRIKNMSVLTLSVPK